MMKSVLLLASFLAASDALSLRSGWPWSKSGPKVHVHYINLDSSTARKDYMEEWLPKAKVAYSRWPAVSRDEVRNLDLKEFSDTGTFEPYMFENYDETTQWGTAACWTSHMRLLKEISEKPEDEIHVILEDDVGLNVEAKDLIPTILDHIKKLPEGWDNFKFGYFGDGGCDEGQQLTESICHWDHPDMRVMGNLGSATTAKGAKNLLAHVRHHNIHDVDGAEMPGGPWTVDHSADSDNEERQSWVQPVTYATTSPLLNSIMGSFGGSERNPSHTWDLKTTPAKAMPSSYGSMQRFKILQKKFVNN